MKRFWKNWTEGQSRLELVLAGAMAAALLFSMISISLTQGALAVALAVWIVLLVRGERKFEAPGFFWPLVAYAALSLLAAALSVNPGLSFKDSRDLLLLLVVPLTLAALRRSADLKLALAAFLGSAYAASLYAVAYEVLEGAPGQRIKGFMAHYMTQAGILTVFAAFALGLLLFGRGKRRIAWAGGLALAGLAIVLTLTRSAWIGLALALAVVLFLWKPKALLALPVIAGLAFLVAPASVRARALSIFTMRDTSNIARVQYARAGLRIIADYPIHGTGPDTVDMVFQDPKYGLGELAKRNVHLHSNIIQIAAERGLPALLAWLAFVALAAASLWRKARERGAGGSRDPVIAGALSVLVAFFVAGFFEYNFGDSEIAQILLVLLSIPFAAARKAGDPAGADAVSGPGAPDGRG
jgi:O-antigen ligase